MHITKSKKVRQNLISRVVSVSPKKEKELIDWSRKMFEKDKYSFERPKTKQEREVVEGILRHMPAFVRQYGIDPVKITTKHVHFIEKNQLTEAQFKALVIGDDAGGGYFPGKRIIVFPQVSLLHNAQNITHEIIHANSWQSANYRDEKYTLRRIGLCIRRRDNLVEYFLKCNEGLTEELVMRFDSLYFHKIPALREGLETRKKFRKIHSRNEREIARVYTRQLPSGVWETTVQRYTYSNERRSLRKLIKELFLKSEGNFKTAEEVFNLFARAALQGDLLPLARVIEKTLGKGTFRKIAEETSEIVESV